MSRQDGLLEALRIESGELSRAVAGLSEAEWDQPTRCRPWSARELLGHVRVVIAWLPSMLEAPAPDRAEVTAAQYYRPDNRFSPQGNAARIDLARTLAAGHADGAALAADFSATWRNAYRRCRDAPDGTVVRTRHGDAMLLSEFVLTRIVEVAVHGLDMADALGREPWLTAQAEAAVLGLLVGPEHLDAVRRIGWDGPAALRKATGRAALDPSEASQVEELGLRWITLG